MANPINTAPPGEEPLVGVVCTDLAAIARGRFVASKNLERIAKTGIGWLQANICLTAFNTIADPNPWGARGDLRMLPDMRARYRTTATGNPTPFDLVFGDIVELDGTPWSCCTRTMLRKALADLEAATGCTLLASFEQEFQISGANLPVTHALSYEALRNANPFAPRLMAALEQAGVDPEVVISEFGQDQFEVTCGPADGITAADRCMVIREITREIARAAGWRASFAPKTSVNGVGNGVHVHFSFRDRSGNPTTYNGERPGGMSDLTAAFCAGILKHLPALTALTAPSIPSYYRLKPHHWSASYTWIASQHREATLRICPVVTIGGRNPASQYNIEYRAADAIANPYLALTALVRAGLEGLNGKLPAPPLVADDPSGLSAEERSRLGLHRLPETLGAALEALDADTVVNGWFDPLFVESFRCVRRAETELLGSLDPQAICEMYRARY